MISEEQSRGDAGVPSKDSRILVERPATAQAVRVHHEEPGGPFVPHLEDLSQLMADRAVLADQTMTTTRPVDEGARDVADAGILNDPRW